LLQVRLVLIALYEHLCKSTSNTSSHGLLVLIICGGGSGVYDRDRTVPVNNIY